MREDRLEIRRQRIDQYEPTVTATPGRKSYAVAALGAPPPPRETPEAAPVAQRFAIPQVTNLGRLVDVFV